MSSTKWGNDIPLYRRADRGGTETVPLARRLTDRELRGLGGVVGNKVHVEREIDEIDARLDELDAVGRDDRRDASARTYLIDSGGGGDADDAITVERDGPEIRIEVHIIDVPYLLDTGFALDQRAAALGKTVWTRESDEILFPGVIYRDHLSFHQGSERPANTVAFSFDEDTELDDVSIYRSLIRPGNHLSYEEADSYLRTPAEEARGIEDRRTIRDMESLKIGALSLLEYQSLEPRNGWGMDQVMEIIQREVNRAGTRKIREGGRGIYRNKGSALGGWEEDAERYLRWIGYDLDAGRIADADDPMRELSELYWDTGNESVGALYDEAVRWAEPGYHRTPEEENEAPLRHSPIPFGNRMLGESAYATFTNPRSNYGDLVNWRSLLGEHPPSPVSLDAVAKNLDAA